MQTVALRPETASKVHQLARVNVDSAQGFLKAAEVVDNPSIASMFRGYASERNQFADQLKAALGTKPLDNKDMGTFPAKLHRWWMDLRGKLSGGDDHTILAEAERGEDQIKAAYEEVVLETIGSPVNDILHAQLRRVKAGHDRILAMRNAAKS